MYLHTCLCISKLIMEQIFSLSTNKRDDEIRKNVKNDEYEFCLDITRYNNNIIKFIFPVIN